MKPYIRRARGFSLLEVVVTLVIVALILVPTTAMMSDATRQEASNRWTGELVQLAKAKQDELGHLTRSNFRNRTSGGNFATEGFPRLRFSSTVSAAMSDGGIPNRLAAIRTFTWDDVNNNRVHDPAEPSIQLWTGVARATP